MAIYCPNYRCHLQQNTAKLCTNCGTSLDISGCINGQAITYQLTKILQDSGGKINDDGHYCWYELFQAQANDTNFVIKMLIIVPDRLSPSNDNHISKVKKRFQREYDLLAKGLNGVCKGYEILNISVGSEVVRSIVMEEVSGLNLEEYVEQNRPIDSQRAMRWIKQLVTIIGGLHKNKIQHRDIKPTNIMVSGIGAAEQLTLIDFGIALETLNDQTTQWMILGSSAYKDPTITDKYRNDSDLYSLGISFIYLLTGQRPPYQDDWCWYNDNNIAHPKINKKLKEIVEKLISKNRSKRFRNTDELLRHIEGKYLPKWLNIILLIVLGLISSLAIYTWLHPQNTVLTKFTEKKYMHPICSVNNLPHKAEINCGQSLDDPKKPQTIEEAFSDLNNDDPKKRNQAVDKYMQKWKSSKGEEVNGERLIYLNNAKVQKDAYQNNSQKIYTLVVSVPSYIQPPNATKNLLSGIALAQQHFNEKSTELKLYIAILKEPSKYNVEQIQEIITRVIKVVKEADTDFNNFTPKETVHSKFIGVIGHYSSRVTFGVLNLYAENKILLVSPSATRSDIPNPKTTVDHLKYFVRLIYNGHGQVNEISNLLRYLSVDKPYPTSVRKSQCGLMNTTLIYEKGDAYANSVGNELVSIFKSKNMPTDRNILMNSHTYELKLESEEEKVIKEITEWIKDGSKPIKIKSCVAAQTVIFIPGAYTTLNDPGQIIKEIAKTLPNEVNLIGNITVADMLSSDEVKKEVKSDLYKKTYIIAPYSILDFLPSYFTPNKSTINSEFFKRMTNDKEDISDIQWRKVSGADSIFTFTRAITEYSKNPEKYKNQSITEAIRDIIKKEDTFSAEGVFGKIEFDGHERRNIKKGTTLKYIPYQDQNTKLALVPLDYRDKNDPSQNAEKYKALKFEDFVSEESRSAKN